MARRVLLAKVGLDGHDTGVRVIARFLREAGLEVIYTGLYQTPDAVARAAVQEDVDVIGLSILSGAHMELASKVMAALREHGATDVPVVVGGTMPAEDCGRLRSAGVAGVFPTGTPLPVIVDYFREAHREQP